MYAHPRSDGPGLRLRTGALRAHRFLFLNVPFLRQSGTIMSGFASTIESISQVRFGGKKGGTER